MTKTTKIRDQRHKFKTSMILAASALVVMAPAMLAFADEPDAVSSDDPSLGTTELVSIKLDGKFVSYPHPDGGDVLVFADGIYITQKWPAQKALMELSAQSAVVFYSHKELPKAISLLRDGSAEAGQALGDLKHPIGVYLEGDVVMQVDRFEVGSFGPISDNQITAERVYYDFTKNRALILDGVLRMNLPDETGLMYVRAEQIRQWSLDHFTARKVKLSNDEFHQPQVWLGVDMVEIVTEKNKSASFEMEKITLNIKDLPVFWWPRASGTSAKSSLPIDGFHTSYSSEFGASLESRWDLAWLLGISGKPKGDTKIKSSFLLDEFSKRGPASGVGLDYSSEQYFGNLQSYLLHDGGEDKLGRTWARQDVAPPNKLRGNASWQHRQYLPYNWEGSFEVSYLSDRNFLESWRKDQFDTEEQETVVYFKQQRNNWAFDILNKFHLNDFQYTRTELPRAGFHMAGQDIFELLTYQHEGYVSRMSDVAGDRDVPGPGGATEPSVLPPSLDQNSFAFALSRHELSMPLQIGPLRVAPTGIGTYIHDESISDHNFMQGAVGLRASTKLWRLDNSAKSRLWDIDRIRHLIIPEVSAFLVDTDLEGFESRDVLNFGINQRWQTKRGPQDDKRSVDFLRLNTSVTLVNNDVDDADLPGRFFFSSPEWQFDKAAYLNDDLANLGLARRERINQNLSDHANADWTWLISDTTVLDGGINCNIHDGLISQADNSIAVQRSPRLRYYFGYRYLRNADPFEDLDASFLTVGTSYKMNRKHTIALSHQYDIERTSASRSQVTMIRKYPHWYGAFSISYSASTGSTSFTLSFWPEGFDKLTLGSRRLTRLTP